MHSQHQLPVLVSLAALVVASPIALEKRVQCTTGAVVFAVRGSDSSRLSDNVNPTYSQLPSGMTAAANAVIPKAGSGYVQAVAYPAAAGSTQYYTRSVDDGIHALQDNILAYINACPSGKIFVLGFSQGAQVMTGALAGSTVADPVKAHE